MKRFLLVTFLILFTLTAYARPDSLQGVDTAKFVVDLNQARANILKTRLSLILETMDNIEDYAVKTTVVVAVRGPDSRFMTVNDSYIAPGDIELKADIAELLDKLVKRGVKLEQCAVALRMLNISKKDINPQIQVVKNGYVSLIGYQNKGYAILPME
ncbi:MAG: hypothetical protein C0602_04145 [Denitrovibrio sp.]|nr:MAG: hypothetical protein C0602_04145 [Denitrovibrio sp.]